MNIKVLEKLGKKITLKKVTIVLGIVFILSLIPIIYLSFFNYATGDDLWEGAAAHQVIVNGGGIVELIKAVKEWFIVDYFGWEGNWSSIILWCLEPSIWGERVYVITAYIALAAICGSSWYFISYFVLKYLTNSNWVSALIFFACNILMIQHVPNIKNAFFWYTGMVNYIVPFGCLLSVVTWCVKYFETQKNKYVVLMSFVMLYMSGAGYPAIVLVLLSIIIECIVYYAKNRKLSNRVGTKVAKIFIPITLLLIGFAISALSPGNAIRGGDLYVFSVTRVFSTIALCFKYGGNYAIEYIFSARLWLVIYPLLGCIVYENIDLSKCRFRFPGMVTIVAVCLWCSGFAPEIYAMDGVSGGVPDTYYLSFVVISFAVYIYWIGWVKSKFVQKEINVLKGTVFVALVAFIIAFSSHIYARMSTRTCMEYILSGQLADYKAQMEERLLILNDNSVKEVVLPEINPEQGPFMHMPLTYDPEAYTNQCLSRFYNKDSVACILRSEWEQNYLE